MNLNHKIVCHELGTAELVENLIQSSFPPDEQEPIERLLTMAEKPMVNFWAYFDDETFCGMIYVVESRDTLFVLYLAVEAELRSQGYGAAIIQDVRGVFGGKDMVLHVEDPYESPENTEQRIHRIRFYERLGFKDTGYRLSPEGTTFWLLSTAEDYQISTYMNLMYEYSDGEYTPPVYRAGER